MADYTPGPWSVERLLWDEETGDVAYILEGIQVANAATSQLIAAAPDTFEVLNMALPYLCDCQSPDCPAYAVRVQALAAIAKAKGDIYA